MSPEMIARARRVDLLALAERDTKLIRKGNTAGGEYHGPCPLCVGDDKGDDRFFVQPNHPDGPRWYCRECGNGRFHDAIEYVRRRHNLTFAEAVQALTGDVGDPSPAPRQEHQKARPAPTRPLAAPPAAWQSRARDFVAECQAALWQPEGARALDWLRRRGLSDETIRGAGLGLNVADRYERREAWGLAPETRADGRPRKVWLPRGIVIPWFIGGDLWRVNIRRPVGDPKYVQAAGGAVALYGADDLSADRPAVLVEGEFDALAIRQHAGDLVTAVAAGSTSGSRRPRWLARVALAPLVLVAFDSDPAGEGNASWWCSRLDRGRRWRPYWSDAAAMGQSGADLRAWIVAGIGQEPARPVATSDAESLYRAILAELDALCSLNPEAVADLEDRATVALVAGDAETLRDLLTAAVQLEPEPALMIEPEPAPGAMEQPALLTVSQAFTADRHALAL